MATKAPRFKAPDGNYRETYIFTTDIASRFFVGTMDADTVDMQVSIRGGGWTSDPDTIYFEGTSFIIPNPSAYPQGLRLLPGANRIEVRSVLSNGESTPSGVIQAHLSLDRDVRSTILAPSGIFVERFDQRVKVTVEGLQDSNVVGYNFYATTAPGGGTLGYFQINPEMVMSGDTVESLETLGTLPVDSLIAVNQDGTPKADPLYLRIVQTQTDGIDGTAVQTDFDQVVQVPENTTRVRTTVQVESVRQVQHFSFVHDRRNNEASSDFPCIPNAEFNTIPDTDPLYYAVTAIYLIDDQEYESVLSPEVAAAPIIVTPAVAALPSVDRQQIVRDATFSIFRSHPDLDFKPGSVLRDTFIDPFSTEAERIRFVIGFMQAAQTFATLLEIDDPGNTGTSIAVSESQYKDSLRKALFLRDDVSVQNLIDNMFDQLAARRGVSRRTGNRSRGEVVFYVNTKPSGSLTLPIGTPVQGANGVTFYTTSAAEISATSGATFFNPSTGRYYARAFIQAAEAGSAGNLAAGQIRVLSSGPAEVQVTNDSPTFGGTDLESNRDLAARADGVLSAVDSGTYRGYTQNAIEVSGIRQVNVVDAGHSLMLRDFDLATNQHTGGKVDVWVRGDNLATLTDSFAFSFEKVLNGQFEPVGDVTNLLFRAVNLNLSADNPIIEMIDLPTWGYPGLKNETTGKLLDLTGATLIAPDKIQLSSTYNDPLNLHLRDEYRGSYRYRTGNKYVLTRQPVTAITSLVGEVTGEVSTDIYKLFHGSDPLNLGRSTEAGDYMQVIQPVGESPGSTIPSGTPVVITNEQHVFLGSIEYLEKLGINPLTIHIWNVDRTVEYVGPYHPLSLGDRDFTFVDESGQIPLGFKATATARFKEGDVLWVDYEHDENFVITYTTNALVSLAQSAIDGDRHVTADVLVKDTIPVGVNIKATVVLQRNQVLSKVDGLIRTNLARLFGSLSLGQPVRQSDIITVIDQTSGVSYVVSPLVTLCKADGALVVRESLISEVEGTDFVKITDSKWASNNLVDVFLLTQKLESGTVHSGGQVNDFRGVFNGAAQYKNYDTPPDVNGVPIKSQQNAAFIIGNDGLDIPGYSDNATLRTKYPFATDAEILQHRIELTQRRVLLALPKGTTPAEGVYTVSYVVYDDSGVKNLAPGPTEYLELGDLDFTYDEDTDFEALVRGKGR